MVLNDGEAKRYFMSATADEFDLHTLHIATATGEVNQTTGIEKAEFALGDHEALILQGNLAGVATVNATGGNVLSLATLTSATAVTANLGAGDDTFLAGGHSTGAYVDGGEGGETANQGTWSTTRRSASR